MKVYIILGYRVKMGGHPKEIIKVCRNKDDALAYIKDSKLFGLDYLETPHGIFSHLWLEEHPLL